MEQARSGGNGFFDVITDKQTYLNMVYIMLALPLGTFYFLYIAAGASVGIGLIPVFIGIPLLYVFVVSIKYLMKFERKLAALLLGMEMEECRCSRKKGVGILVRFRDELFSIELWKAIVYLISKLLLGTMLFALCAALVSLSLGLLSAPIVYEQLEYNLAANGGTPIDANGMRVNSLLGLMGISASPEQELLILMVLGVFMGISSLHLFNKAAYLLGRFLKAMSPHRRN